MTMTLVSTVTVGSGGAADITFASIPQTETDLLILVSGTPASASQTVKLWMQINSTSANYSYIGLRGTGSGALRGINGDGTDRFASTGLVLNSTTANTFANISIYIPNYTSSVAKLISFEGVGENNATAAEQDISAGYWNNTAAITSIKLYMSQNFAQYSTASLYTITKGSGGATVS